MMGDCWTGAILLSPFLFPTSPPIPSSSTPLPASAPLHHRADSGVAFPIFPPPDPPVGSRLAVLDFEFATLHRARGLDGDIAQLLAHLLLYVSLATHHRNRPLYAAAAGLVDGVVRAYVDVSREEGAWWIRAMQEGEGKEVRRKVLSGVGVEMVCAGMWREWVCRCCGGGGGRMGRKEECELVREFVGEGVRYLRTAVEEDDPGLEEEDVGGDVGGGWNEYFGIEIPDYKMEEE